MRKILVSIISVIMLASISCSMYYCNGYKKISDELAVAVNNNKAYSLENSSLKKENRVYKLTAEQLEYYSDSITVEMDRIRKELKIKDKDLQYLQYLLSTSERIDTVTFQDTIFSETTFHVDTLIGDKWYQLKLGMKFPNVIAVHPKFVSEKYIVTHSKKETVNPPKKFFLFRWFQKKHCGK